MQSLKNGEEISYYIHAVSSTSHIASHKVYMLFHCTGSILAWTQVGKEKIICTELLQHYSDLSNYFLK